MSDEQPKCVRETQEMTCLNCGQDAHILVAAECWVRLLPDDQVESEEDYEWELGSSALCTACSYSSTVSEFRQDAEQQEEEAVSD
jgi:hypothetical protein